MTVNVALLTSDALVMGCDSIASVTTPLLDPFSAGVQVSRDKSGSGKLILEVEPGSLQRYVTNTWDGVTKLFQIYDGKCPAAAMTAGLAKLNGKTMEQIAHEYYQKQKSSQRKLVNVEAVVNSFSRHLKSEYERHYKNSKISKEYRDGPEFLIGGYGRDDVFPSLYKVIVKEDKVEEVYPTGETGIAWNGQSNAVERFLLGYDGAFRMSIYEQHSAGILKVHAEFSEKLSKILQEIVDKTGISLPEGIETDLTIGKPTVIKLDDHHTDISYSSLPLQSAVDLVAELVKLQSAYARFESGIPTVGGRVLVGILTKKKECLDILGESELQLS